MLCFVVVMQSFIMNSHEVFIHIHQGSEKHSFVGIGGGGGGGAWWTPRPNPCAHFVTSGALLGICLMHYGNCEMGVFTMDFNYNYSFFSKFVMDNFGNSAFGVLIYFSANYDHGLMSIVFLDFAPDVNI